MHSFNITCCETSNFIYQSLMIFVIFRGPTQRKLSLCPMSCPLRTTTKSPNEQFGLKIVFFLLWCLICFAWFFDTFCSTYICMLSIAPCNASNFVNCLARTVSIDLHSTVFDSIWGKLKWYLDGRIPVITSSGERYTPSSLILNLFTGVSFKIVWTILINSGQSPSPSFISHVNARTAAWTWRMQFSTVPFTHCEYATVKRWLTL